MQNMSLFAYHIHFFHNLLDISFHIYCRKNQVYMTCTSLTAYRMCFLHMSKGMYNYIFYQKIQSYKKNMFQSAYRRLYPCNLLGKDCHK